MIESTNAHQMLFVKEEGMVLSLRSVKEVIGTRGLFAALCTDRGSYSWHTAQAGGKVDKTNLTQFGRAMVQLGIEMIPTYSPEAQGCLEETFRTLQRQPFKRQAAAGIRDMGAGSATRR